MKIKKIAFMLLCLCPSFLLAEYRIQMTSDKVIDIPEVSSVIAGPDWSSYDTHVTYKLSEMDASLFSSPATGFTSGTNETTEGVVLGSAQWSTRAPYKAMRPGYEKKTAELNIYEESYTSASGNAILGFTFNEPKVITKALYVGWYDYETEFKVAYPNSFRFEGSHDGSSWVPISDWYTPPASKGEDEFVVYKFDNETAYKSYQIRMQNGSTIRAQYQYVKSLFFYE